MTPSEMNALRQTQITSETQKKTQKTADLVTCTDETLNGKLHFFCNEVSWGKSV